MDGVQFGSITHDRVVVHNLDLSNEYANAFPHRLWWELALRRPVVMEIFKRRR
jgi:hypothetical protein